MTLIIKEQELQNQLIFQISQKQNQNISNHEFYKEKFDFEICS